MESLRSACLECIGRRSRRTRLSAAVTESGFIEAIPMRRRFKLSTISMSPWDGERRILRAGDAIVVASGARSQSVSSFQDSGIKEFENPGFRSALHPGLEDFQPYRLP